MAISRPFIFHCPLSSVTKVIRVLSKGHVIYWGVQPAIFWAVTRQTRDNPPLNFDTYYLLHATFEPCTTELTKQSKHKHSRLRCISL